MYYRPTIKKILLILVAALSLPLVFSSCADKDEIEASPSIKNEEYKEISIRFSMGGDATTRTASDKRDNVASNSALNEDKIARLDLFVVENDANKSISEHKSLKVKTTIDDTSGLVSYTDDNEDGAEDQLNAPETGVTYKPTWTVPGLTYSSINGKTVYLVANWTNCPDNISTLSDLTKALTSDNGGCKITPYSNQDGFFMDGKLVATSSNLTSTDEKNYTLSSIELKRAVAKIRLTVYREEKSESDPTVERTLEEITNSSMVTYKLMNYATEGTVVADNSDAKVRCEKGTTSPEYKKSSINLSSMESALAGNSESMEKNMETVEGPTKISYNGSDYNISNYKAAVFYVYPNDWIDPWKRNDDYSLTSQILNPTSLPIIEERRTYFMLTGIYNDSKTYDYTVPVNYQMPTNNDKTTIGDYEDLYQLKRNYIYDVIAILDRQGGQNGLYLVYRENPWTQGSSYTLTDFNATLTFEDNSKVYTIKSDDLNAIKVAYDETNQTSYSPTMTITVSGTPLKYTDKDQGEQTMSDIGDKPWIIHTDNPYFGFLYNGSVVDQISCTSETKSATFQLVPKVALADNPSPLAKVYVTVVASGTSGEIYLSTPSDITVPMEGNKILFYQVTTDDYK